jgi:hypothetical protein
VHVDRLLDELDADVLEAPQRITGLEDGPRLVGIDSHGNAVANLVLDRASQRDVVVEVEPDLDVDGAEPLRGALGGLATRRLGGAVVDPDKPVERHRLGVQAAEELMDRTTVRLAADVPQRHLDRCCRRIAEVRVVVPSTVRGTAQELSDPHRILADDPRDRRLEGVAHQCDQRAARHLADPADPGVGVDLDDRVGQPPHPTESPGLGVRERD